MAIEVAALVDYAKSLDGKNAITLFETNTYKTEDSAKNGKIASVGDHRYSWSEFEKNVINEKLITLNEYFKQSEDHGMAFLYHLVELLRNTEEKINTARYVYLLSRMEPQDDKKRIQYAAFSRKMYEWSKNNKDRKELITAIYLYVYLNREGGEEV